MTIFQNEYDWNLHKSERNSEDFFTYQIPVQSQNNYLLIFYIHERENLNVGDRVFNIYVENSIVFENLDIQLINQGHTGFPIAVVFSFYFDGKYIVPKNREIQEIQLEQENQQILKVKFEAKKYKAKVDGIILYKGNEQDLARDISQQMINEQLTNLIMSFEKLSGFLVNKYSYNLKNWPIFPLASFIVEEHSKYINELKIKSGQQYQKQEENNIKNRQNNKSKDNYQNTDIQQKETNEDFQNIEEQKHYQKLSTDNCNNQNIQKDGNQNQQVQNELKDDAQEIQKKQEYIEKFKSIQKHQQQYEENERQLKLQQKQQNQPFFEQFFRFIDQFWLWNQVKDQIATFFLFLGQNYVILILGFVNLIFMIVCLRPNSNNVNSSSKTMNKQNHLSFCKNQNEVCEYNNGKTISGQIENNLRQRSKRNQKSKRVIMQNEILGLIQPEQN